MPINVYFSVKILRLFFSLNRAEDLEAQGKNQLELDEAAFSFLDDSLPGRQRVIVRSPYFEGLPADIAERRVHGVLEGIMCCRKLYTFYVLLFINFIVRIVFTR